VSRYQKGKTNLDFTEARDSEWQWHQLGHMQICTSLQKCIIPKDLGAVGSQLSWSNQKLVVVVVACTPHII